MKIPEDLQSTYKGACLTPRDRLIKKLIERISALDWQPITSENLPKVGDEAWSPLGYIVQVRHNWTDSTGFTHVRSINGPKVQP